MAGDIGYDEKEREFLAQCREEMLSLCWTRPHFLPFFAVVKLIVTKHPSIETMAIDCLGNIYMNYEFASSLTPQERVGVLCHEVMHPLLMHHARRDGRQPRPWGVVADMTINHFLKICDVKLPEDVYYPPAGKEHYTAEQLYEELPTMTIKIAGGGAQPAPGKGCGIIDPLPGAPGTGTAPGEEGKGSRPGVTVHEDARGNVTITVDQSVLDEMAQKFTDAAAQAQMLSQGTAVGNLLANITSPPEPRVDWATILRNGFGEAAASMDRDDVTWMRRSRRSSIDGPQLPGWQAQQVRGCVVIDVSGSMSDEDVTQCIVNAVGIADAVKAKLFLVIHDAGVQYAGWIDGEFDEIAKLVTGRGGTLFEPAYNRIAEEDATFDVMIHLTDGGVGHWPNRPPNVARGIAALLGYQYHDSLPPDLEVIDARL